MGRSFSGVLGADAFARTAEETAAPLEAVARAIGTPLLAVGPGGWGLQWRLAG